MSKLFIRFYGCEILAGILVAALLPSCAPKALSSGSKTTSSALASGSGLGLSYFYPASATVSSIPATVTLAFNTSDLINIGSGAVSLASNYSLFCGTGLYNPTAVAYTAGSAYVAVTLPVLPDLESGTICTLSASPEIRDGSGDYLGGVRSVAYTLGALSTWSPGTTANYTALAGGTGGTAYSDVSTSTSVLSGLYVYSGATFLNGLRGIWRTGFSYGSSSTIGGVHGTASGTLTVLQCPAGSRITGVTGRQGSYLYALGLTCKNLEQTQTYTIDPVGGSGGTTFELNCPTGMFATNLAGRSGTYVDQLQIGCR